MLDWISFAFAVITGIISYFGASFSFAETLRWSLYDFLFLQIFLIVLEIYKDHSSEVRNLMKKEKYISLMQNLNHYEEEKENKDSILDELLSILIEECKQYCRLESANGQTISMRMAELLIKRLSEGKSQRCVVCHIKKFSKMYVDESTEAVVIYEDYTDMYKSSVNFSELSEKYDIRFYRKRREVQVEPFCLINGNLLLTERDKKTVGSTLLKRKSKDIQISLKKSEIRLSVLE